MSQNNITTPKAVNWLCEAFCNYRCKFCYAGFELQRMQPKITLENGFRISSSIVESDSISLDTEDDLDYINMRMEDDLIRLKYSNN